MDEVEVPVETEADLFRAIGLAVGPHDHEDACHELAALRRLGWTITTSGHMRGGEMTITLRSPRWAK